MEAGLRDESEERRLLFTEDSYFFCCCFRPSFLALCLPTSPQRPNAHCRHARVHMPMVCIGVPRFISSCCCLTAFLFFCWFLFATFVLTLSQWTLRLRSGVPPFPLPPQKENTQNGGTEGVRCCTYVTTWCDSVPLRRCLCVCVCCKSE